MCTTSARLFEDSNVARSALYLAFDKTGLIEAAVISEPVPCRERDSLLN